jgi:suppressor of ftsI
MTTPGPFPDFTMSRRKFLGLSAGALATIGLGSSAHSTPTGSYFYEPEVRSSVNGFLRTSLRASESAAIFQGDPAVAWTYEGSFTGPTLHVRPGDFVAVELINDLPEPTNIHVHGVHVSPLTPSDNVLLHILPGQRFQYEYTIPHDHPGGTYFYHPHFHTLAANQVFKGLTGMIIIEGDIDQIPGIAGLPERQLVMQRNFIRSGAVPTLSPNAGVGIGNVMVNGALAPIMFIRPGETQRWRLLNASVSSFWTIQIQDHDMTLISQDGNTLANAETVSSVDIVTAQRRDVLVQGGRPGVYPVTYIDNQTPLGVQPPVTLAYLVVMGAAVEPQPLPTTLLPFVDLRNLPVNRQRSIEFQIIGDPAATTFAGQGFVIDGKAFDPNRVDQFGRLGDTEEWTVNNPTGLAHPFHIHINPYQVTKINGQPYDALSYEDVTAVPANGSITFRTRLLDFPGTWVFHCHILGHEDGGMMGIIQVS